MLEKRSAELSMMHTILHQETERRQKAESELLIVQAQLDALKRQFSVGAPEKGDNGGGQPSDFIPICAACKKVRDDEGVWRQIENYLQKRTSLVFSHGICADCSDRLYPELREEKK